MKDNDVWDLIDLLDNLKPIGWKLVFKTKRNWRGNFERSKAMLVAKGFTQSEGIHFKIHYHQSLVKNHPELLLDWFHILI